MANEGMGMAGGFAEAAGGVMSGFQYARQQQALEQQRKQQELQDAENRADSKMKRELLMKEIQNKEKAREIYAMDPVKDFGLDAKGFANRDLYEAELSKRYAAEFRKAGLGEESVKHESVGGQFYEQGMKKASKKAFGMALSGDTDGAKKVLDSIGFNIDKIQEFKQKDGSKGFHIIDKIGEGENAPEKIVSTIGVAELAGVMGDEDLMMEFLVKKDSEITSNYNKLQAQIDEEKRLEARDIRKELRASQSAGVDPAVKKQQDEALSEAAIFRTKDGTEIIVGEDLKVTKGLFESGHNLASINKMRQKRGLPEIEIKSMSKDQLESMGRQYSGLNNEEMSSDRDIELGADWYGRISPQQKGEVLKPNPMGGKTPTPPNTPEVLTPMGGGTPTPTPKTTKGEPSIYDKKGLTVEERKEFDSLYNDLTLNGKITWSMNPEKAGERKRFNELKSVGRSRMKKPNDNLSTQVGR